MEIGAICGMPSQEQQPRNKMSGDVVAITEQTSQLDTTCIPSVLMIITPSNECYVADWDNYMSPDHYWRRLEPCHRDHGPGYSSGKFY